MSALPAPGTQAWTPEEMGRREAKTPAPPEDGLRETAGQRDSQEAEGPVGGGGARLESTRPALRSQPLRFSPLLPTTPLQPAFLLCCLSAALGPGDSLEEPSPKKPNSGRRCPSTPGPRRLRLARTRPQWRSPSPPFCPGQPASAPRDRQTPLPGIRRPTDLSEDRSERDFFGGGDGKCFPEESGDRAASLGLWKGVGRRIPCYFSSLPPSCSGTHRQRFQGLRPLFKRTSQQTSLASQG